MERHHTPSIHQSEPRDSGARAARDRLFFAVYPDSRTANRIVELAGSVRAANRLRGTPLRADRMHVTLHYLGDHTGLPQSLVMSACAAAAKILESSFEIAFDRVASFPARSRGGKRPCVLSNDAADANPHMLSLQRTLGEHLCDADLGHCVERSFSPHVTLLYDKQQVAPECVPAVTWTAREFVLVHSLFGKAEHRVLDRWKLR